MGNKIAQTGPGTAPEEGIERLHKPVMLEECLAFLEPARGGVFVDATVGPGGHARAIGEALGNKGALFGIDLDPDALAIAGENLAGLQCDWHLMRGNYVDMSGLLAAFGVQRIDGVLFDFGPSSLDLDQAEKGFSFRLEGPLDMRYDPQATTTARDLVNGLPEHELARIFWEYGDEIEARRIARAIERQRAQHPFNTTVELAEFVARLKRRTRSRIHPATRVFQALRIATNDELSNVERGLETALTLLAPGARLVAISYHSGEHRLLKWFLRKNSGVCVCPPEVLRCECGARDSLSVLTKRGVSPSFRETRENPRARSAKLRAAQRRDGDAN